MLATTEFDQLQTRVQQLNSNDNEFCHSVCTLRDQIDDAYERRLITLQQWRALFEEASIRQARYALTKPEGWRCGMRAAPTSEPVGLSNDDNYVR